MTKLIFTLPSRQARSVIASACLIVGANLMAQEVPRAVPVEEGANSTPIPRAEPVGETVKRAGPDEDLYEYATLCYNQKDYAIAVKPLMDYVTLYPQGRHASEAWFRLGECYMNLGKEDDAKMAYQETIKRHPRSESAASAAYRLAAYAYRVRDFLKAANYFETCTKLTTSPEVKLASAYNTALCYKQAGEKKRAQEAFNIVASMKEPNKFRESALIEIASYTLESGKREEALSTFNEIASLSKDSIVQADALLKAGLILNEKGQGEDALKNFKKVLGIEGLSNEQRGIAVFGIIQASFVKEDFDTVINTYNANPTSLPPEDLRGKLLLIVGSALKAKQQYNQAVQTFLQLETDYPKSPEAFEAGYQKLLCFNALGGQEIPEFAEQFESKYKEQYSKHEYIQMSRLLRAFWWFSKADYAKASEAFAGVEPAKIPDKIRAGALYQKGFAEAESQKYNDAISTLTIFITDYPKDANVPAALAQRGLSQKSVRAFDKALADFTEVVKSHPEHPAGEIALYQSALIKGETRDLPGMIADLESLIKKFPQSPAAAEANFRVGKGYFDLGTKENWKKAIAPLHRSIELNSKDYLDKASQLLVSTEWLREEMDSMAKEVDNYLQARPDAIISPKALTALGVYFFKRGDFRSSSKYLNLACNPAQPEATEAPIWNFLGQAEYEIGNYDASIKALDFYLSATPQGEGRAVALMHKAQSLLKQGKFADAELCTDEGLQLVKVGRLRGKLQLLSGDIAMEKGNALAANNDAKGASTAWNKAAGDYVVVSQIFVDPEITPEAADKAATALEKTGDKDKAANFREQLKTKYPHYKPKTAAAASNS